MNLRSVVIVLSIVMLVGFLTTTVIAQSKLDVFENSTHHSATSSVVIQNEYLKIEVGNNGQYRGWTSAGDAIFYPYGTYPWSSFITIKVNGSIYDNAPWSSNLDNYLTQETVKKSPVETETKWYIPEEDLEITQNIILVGEQAKFILELKNKGTVTKTVSVRYEWDTQIADNDGAPLREEGGDLHEFEIAFEPITFSYWSAYARPQPGSLVIYATWDTTPDKIIFAHWPGAYDTLWDYSWSSSRRFYTPGYTTSPESDSCVLMYWKDISLSPDEEKSIVAYYGTTVGGGVNVDVSMDKEYYTSTENIKLSVKVTDASGNPLYPLEKENFKVFVDGNEVNIEKFERISATDYRLEIKSPQSVGTHLIMVRADTATGWDSDTVGIKVYKIKISKVSLSIGGNRLTQYKNSADTPIYYRGDSNVYPVFFVDVEVEGATLPDVKNYIQVFVNINDYAKSKYKVIKASYDSDISKYKAEWKDIPNSYPVGKYNVTAEVRYLKYIGIDTNRNVSNAVDCLKNKGIQFVGRYFAVPHTQKVITNDEAQKISDAGMYIVSIWQTTANYPEYFSYNQGKSDGKNAFKYAAEIGQTPNTPVYFAVDFDATLEHKQRILDYFGGVKDGYEEYLEEHHIPYKIGVYGSYWVLNWLKEQGIATYFYQAYAPGWSGGENKNPWPDYNIRQIKCSLPSQRIYLCGIEIDYDIGTSDFGGWRYGSSPLSSGVRHFYLIFKPPAGYENFVKYGISAEIHNAYPAPDPIPGARFIGTKFYNLRQFEYRNWKNTLDFLTGPNKFGWDPHPAIFTERQAIERLITFAHGIDIGGSVDDSYYGYWHMDDNESEPVWDITHIHGNYIYGTFGTSKDYPADGLWPGQNAWWYDVNKFKDSNFNPENKNLPHNRPTGVCADYAPLLISHARSAGIPAREIGGFFAGGGGHAVTEVYYDGEWYHVDPTWNEMERPWTYSEIGYYWTSYKTSSISPWSVVPLPPPNPPYPGIKIDVMDRKDYYNYIPKAININFDKTDYNYPDTVNVDITVKNTGRVPITQDYLHLLVFDKPTILRLGPTRLKCDIQITEDLDPGDTKTYTCQYQLPDYGILNGFYEWFGDRYVVAQIDYYNRTFPPYHSIATVSKVEKRVPGLCNEWNSQIAVDNLAITLNTANITSISFNETTNESIETFDKPLNTSVTVRHKVKYYTNYTREIWYISNPDNRTHSYNLMTPLLGIGNAVYIPGYGSVTTNQSINTDVSYLIVYNTTTGTNDSVDIYAFSRNTTLKNITIFNGLVKVVGTWNTSLAQESGISYLSYFSARNGSGMNFDEIYRDFAREIINNGDTLTQFFIEGEDGQISYYKIRDIAYISVEVINNGVLPETRNLNLVITEPGPWGLEFPVYNTTKTVTVSAGDTTTVTFQYQIPDNTSIGWHGVKVSDGIARAETIFIVRAPFNVSFDIPPNVTQSEEFYVNATIRNELDITLSEINVTIDLSNDFNTSENLTKFVGTLSSGESAKVSWLVTATDFEYGYAPFTLYIDSAEGIGYIASAYTNVLRLPELRIYPSAPSEVRVGVPFILRVNVTNEGDLGMNNVSIRLYLPDNVTTNDSLTESIGDLEAGEVKTIIWEITSMRDSDFWIDFEGWDESRTYYDNATIFINIVKPEIELDLINPAEVILNQSFSVIAKIKNIGELNATQVKVNLSLPSEFETANDTFVNIGNLSTGQTKEVEWTLKGVNPGYGDITVNVTLSGDVSITSGIIVTCFPLLVETDKNIYMRGDNVKITSNTTNENPEVSYVDLVMNVTIQGPNIIETYDRPILYIGGLESQNVIFTWDTTGKPLGNYIVTARILETTTVLSEASTSFVIASEVSVPLYTGWNMISLPLRPDNLSASSVLATIPNAGGIAYLWNASKGAYDAIYGDIELEPGRAYWISVTGDGTWTPTGSEIHGTKVNLTPGWNMI
ncbi:MAG: hypothetical protein DRQ24_07780, partial [Candidatus Latescibacterota bacterium]